MVAEILEKLLKNWIKNKEIKWECSLEKNLKDIVAQRAFFIEISTQQPEIR